MYLIALNYFTDKLLVFRKQWACAIAVRIIPRHLYHRFQTLNQSTYTNLVAAHGFIGTVLSMNKFGQGLAMQIGARSLYTF